MKYFNSLLIIFFTFSTLTLAFTQVTPVLNGLNGPWGITIDNDVMYIGENGADRVIKADLTESSLITDVYVTGLNGAASLLTIEDTLYIGERNGNRIAKYTTTEAGGDAETCVSLEFPPVGLAHKNGSIYIAEREGNKISRTNILSGCGAGFNTIIGDINQAYGIAIDGDNLYCSDADGGFVFSINLTDKQYIKDTIVNNLSTPAGLLVLDDQLYIADFGADRVIQVSLDESAPSTVIHTTGAGPLALAADSAGKVYVTEFTVNRVSELTPPISDTDDIDIDLHVNLYPNPADNVLHLESTERFDNYLIRNTLGTVVQMGNVLSDQTLIIETLIPGNYYLSLDNATTLEFVKN